jgi:hypothetical protein
MGWNLQNSEPKQTFLLSTLIILGICYSDGKLAHTVGRLLLDAENSWQPLMLFAYLTAQRGLGFPFPAPPPWYLSFSSADHVSRSVWPLWKQPGLTSASVSAPQDLLPADSTHHIRVRPGTHSYEVVGSGVVTPRGRPSSLVLPEEGIYLH